MKSPESLPHPLRLANRFYVCYYWLSRVIVHKQSGYSMTGASHFSETEDKRSVSVVNTSKMYDHSTERILSGR